MDADTLPPVATKAPWCPIAHQRERCHRKHSYLSKREAKAMAKYLMRKTDDHPWLRHYRCPVCRLYHLTSQPLSG